MAVQFVVDLYVLGRYLMSYVLIIGSLLRPIL